MVIKWMDPCGREIKGCSQSNSPLRTQRHRICSLPQRFPAICPWSLHKLSEQTIAWMDDGWHLLDFYLPSAVFGMIHKMSVFLVPVSNLLWFAYVRDGISHEVYYCSGTLLTWSSQSCPQIGDRKAGLGPDSPLFNGTRGILSGPIFSVAQPLPPSLSESISILPVAG